MKSVNRLHARLSIICSSGNSIILGLSFTSFNILESISKFTYVENSFITYSTLSSLAVSSIFLGGLLFNIFNKMKNEKILILFSTFTMLVGYLLMYVYPSVYLILVSRIIIGLGCGCACFVVPQYIYTLASEENKGLWCSIHPINMNLGILLGQSLIKFNTVESWMTPYRIINIVLCFLLLSQIFILDTDKGTEESVSIRELINNEHSLKSIIVVCLMHISQHLSGIDYISIYLPEILNNDYLLVLGIYFLTVPSVIISSILLNKYGRKYLYMISVLLLGISSVVLIKYKVYGLIVFLIGYNIGVSNVPWVLPNECTPERYVPPITNLGIICNWGSAYILLTVLSQFHKIFGDVIFLLYSISMLGMLIFTYVYVPETKGNTEFI
ncbi:hypothetical protein P3W45_000792 [Vairimorpha bombi]|jgi:MFS family permease